MVKVKEFYTELHIDNKCGGKIIESLEDRINEFLEENDVQVIDIKYCVNFGNFNESQALLIYRELHSNEKSWIEYES